MTRTTTSPAVFAAALLFGCGAPQTVEERTSTAVEDPRPAAAKSDRSRGTGKTNEPACAAAQHRTLVGRPIDEIDISRLPGPLRIYVAGDPITMDDVPNRLNFVVGADGHVVAVKCG